MESVWPELLAPAMINLNPPEGEEDDVAPLPVLIEDEKIDDEHDARVIRSYWRLTPEEIGELARGGYVRLTVWGAHPPVSLVTVDGDDPTTTRVPQ